MRPLARKIPPARGFTLIELLVVIVLIAVLAALGFSGAGAAIRKSQTTECLSNMRQIGTAMHLFVGENGGRLPSVGHKGQRSWTNTLQEFLGTNFIGRCLALKHYPEQIEVTYGWNDMLTEKDTWRGLPMSRISQPSETILSAEKHAGLGTNDHFHFRSALGSRGRISLSKFESQVNTKAHGTRASYLFVDGHVESLSAKDVGARLATNSPPFLSP